VLATLTSKGQLTLPKALRDRLHLRAGDRVEFVVNEDGRVELIPLTSSVSALKGMVSKPEVPVSLEAMDDAVRRGAGRG